MTQTTTLRDRMLAQQEAAVPEELRQEMLTLIAGTKSLFVEDLDKYTSWTMRVWLKSIGYDILYASEKGFKIELAQTPSDAVKALLTEAIDEGVRQGNVRVFIPFSELGGVDKVDSVIHWLAAQGIHTVWGSEEENPDEVLEVGLY